MAIGHGESANDETRLSKYLKQLEKLIYFISRKNIFTFFQFRTKVNLCKWKLKIVKLGYGNFWQCQRQCNLSYTEISFALRI